MRGVESLDRSPGYAGRPSPGGSATARYDDAPVLGENSGLKHCRHRPPPDREGEDQGIVALDARHLGQHLGRIDLALVAPIGLVGLAKARIEVLAIEIGELDRVPRGDRAFDEGVGNRAGQLVAAWMAEDDENFHWTQSQEVT